MKIFLWIIGIPFTLIIIIVIALQFSGVQLYVTEKATGYLSKKIKTKVTLKKINLAFPKMIALEDLYIEDQKKDTLLYSHALKVDLNLWDLLSKKIILSSVELEKLTGHVSRADSTFNFDFITDAFSSGKKTSSPKDTVPSAWQFAIKAVRLKDIYFTYHDQSSGVMADVHLGAFDTEIDDFDLDNKKIHVQSLALKNTSALLIINPIAKKESAPSEPFDYDLGISHIELAQIKAIYKDGGSGDHMNLELGKLLLDADKIDIAHEAIALKQLRISKTNFAYTIGKQQNISSVDPKAAKTNAPEAGNTSGWTVSLKKLDLDSTVFAYNDNNQAPLKKGMDYSHLRAQHLKINADNIFFTPQKINLQLNALGLEEQSGFVLHQLKTSFSYDSTHVKLAGLNLETGNSHINGELGISYRSMQQLQDSIGALGVNMQLKKITVAVSDILFFVPGLLSDSLLKNNHQTLVALNGSIQGTLDQLNIPALELKTQQSTVISLKGSVQHIRNPKAMYARLQSFSISGSEKDILSVINKSAIPKGFNIPASFHLNGSFKGYLKNFDADLSAKTSFGTVKAVMKMNPAAGNVEQPYAGNVSAESFDPGKLLGNKDLGPVTMTASIKGSGLDLNTLNALVQLHVDSARLKGYTYKALSVDGQISNKTFAGKASMNDKNLAFNFDGSASIDPAKPDYVFTLDLKGADLKALNLSPEDLRVSALLKSDIHDGQGKNITGKAAINNILVIRNNKRYPLDSVVFISKTEQGVSDISLTSDLFAADFKGEITLAQLPDMLHKHVNNYFKMQPESKQNLDAQKFSFDFKLINPELAENLIPNLQNLSPFFIKGGFDSEAKKLDLQLNSTGLVYSGIKIDCLKLEVHSNAEKLMYHLGIAEVSNPTIKFENVYLGGELKDERLSFQFNTNKDDSAKTLSIGGDINELNKNYTLRINKDLILNTEKWTVDPANSFEFGASGFRANKFSISKGSSEISVNSTEAGYESPLEIRFKDFDLAVISKLIENNNDLLKGLVKGNVILEKHNNAPAFRSELEIDNFAFKAVPVGTIKLKADNIENPGKYDVSLGIEGGGNNIQANGSYLAASKDNSLDFILDVKNLNLASIEPFTFGQVTKMKGAVTGKLNVKGSPSVPDITGDLNFKESSFRPRIIDSYLTIHDGRMSFESKKINIKNLALYDSLNNKALVNGFVGLQDLNNINFDLQLKTTNFLALNTDRFDNPLYYGRVFLDSDIHMKGTTDAPQLDVKARLNKGSYITYVKPEDEVAKNENKGIVEFADTLYHPGIMTRLNDTLKGSSNIKGMNLSASINFDKSVQLKMLVDQESGDSLFVIGSGALDFTMDQSGKTSLTGKYKINDGGYHLSISDVVKRDFRIEKGSSVTWSGDPLDAYVDLKAIYTIKTSPIDLVQDDLSGMTELEKNKYRNMLTFLVYLKMTGFISSPDISFDIQLSPDDRGALNGAINSKLAQLHDDESELNKQVFALLTLKRFIGDNPLDNGSDGGGLGSASRSSASKVLTQQLNTLSDKYVNFVDLDLGVNSFEDYSSGQGEGRTQLQLGVSKQLLNDKVTVRVGGNVELEGERARQNNANDVAGNISIDYKLTQDGRYKLKAFRENQYENPIEGELTRTGAGIVYVRNYNKLKELLNKPVKKDKIETEKKENDN